MEEEVAREINGMICPKSLLREPLRHGSEYWKAFHSHVAPLAALVVTLQHSRPKLAAWFTSQVTSPLEQSKGNINPKMRAALDRMMRIAKMVLGPSARMHRFRMSVLECSKGQYSGFAFEHEDLLKLLGRKMPRAEKWLRTLSKPRRCARGRPLTGTQIAERLRTEGGVPGPADLFRGALASSQSAHRVNSVLSALFDRFLLPVYGSPSRSAHLNHSGRFSAVRILVQAGTPPSRVLGCLRHCLRDELATRDVQQHVERLIRGPPRGGFRSRSDALFWSEEGVVLSLRARSAFGLGVDFEKSIHCEVHRWCESQPVSDGSEEEEEAAQADPPHHDDGEALDCSAVFGGLDRRRYGGCPGLSACARRCCLECLERWTDAGYYVNRIPFAFERPKPAPPSKPTGGLVQEDSEQEAQVACKKERWNGPAVQKELERLEEKRTSQPDDRSLLYAVRLLREVLERGTADGDSLWLQVPYHQVGGIGRAYSKGASMQKCPSSMRRKVCPGYSDVDIENAHFAILCSLANRESVPVPHSIRYMEQRDLVLEDIQRHYGRDCVQRSDAKRLILRILNGGAVAGWAKQLGLDPFQPPPRVVSGIASERARLQSLVVKEASTNVRASFARALHEIEFRCLRAMEAELEQPVDAYIHDGMMVRTNGQPLGPETLKRLEAVVLKECGIRLRLTETVF